MSRAKKISLSLSLLMVLIVCTAAFAGTEAPIPTFSQPAVSPDGSQIAFASGGDLWTVPVNGGTAHLLVADPATESRPLYSPDGKQLAFVSTRTGNGDVYVLTLATGETRRLTWDDELEQLDAWSRDGRWIYFSSTSHDIANMNDVYRVHPEGGTPLEVSADRYVNEFFSAPSPDGKALAFSARGVASNQWWRHGHSHLDEAEIWVLQDGAYRKLSPSGPGAKDLWAMWSPDGQRIFYCSDRGGAENLWMQELSGPGAQATAPRPLTQFTDGRLLWPTLSWDGRTLVFERNFGVWKLDTVSGAAAEVPITLEGAPAGPGFEHLTLTSDFNQTAVSPDGKKVAFLAHGDVFAAPAKEGGTAARLTETAGPESQLAWAPDSRRLVYVADRDGDGVGRLFLYDFASNKETRLTEGPADTPRFSPDGKLLAFQRKSRALYVLDLATGKERLLVQALFDEPPLGSERPFEWSPDSRWIAFVSFGDRLFRNVQVVPAAGGTPRPVSFLANLGGDDVTWSPDGKSLFFVTGQRSENTQVARIDLQPRTPKFPEDQFRDLFQPEPPPKTDADPKDVAAKKPSPAPAPATPKAEIDFDGIRRRMTFLPTGLDAGQVVISPDGKWLVLTATLGTQSNLYAWSLDELAKEPPVPKQLTSTPGPKSSLQFSPDSKEVYYLDGGSLQAVALDAPNKPRPIALRAEMSTDFAQEKMAIFDQAWSILRDNFVDPGMHGVDWPSARAVYRPRAAAARTPDDLRRGLNLMIGELNASHSGVRVPAGSIARSTGHLGLRFDRAASESSGRLLVREVVPLGPAAVTGKIKVGDVLLAVDGKTVDGTTNLDQLLDHRINRQVRLTVAANGTDIGKDRREVAVRPVDQRTEKGLVYTSWVEANRQYVARVSGGRLGYVHMFDMGASSLAQLLIDLDAENQARDGVVVDIRNNNGGFVNPYAIDILARRGYMSMTFRGLPTAPARTVLGQRALERPTVLVTNQHSLSDAEDFSEGYRTLGLGKIVGEPTGGWIIYTSDVDLLDGAQVRVPFIKITGHDGEDMEMHPRPVDVEVVRPIGEGLAGKDSQLDTAVRELLQQIGPATKR
jgi:Tol biopolymer transport system component/C-terminal processing protease CtpA/Prc